MHILIFKQNEKALTWKIPHGGRKPISTHVYDITKDSKVAVDVTEAIHDKMLPHQILHYTDFTLVVFNVALAGEVRMVMADPFEIEYVKSIPIDPNIVK